MQSLAKTISLLSLAAVSIPSCLMFTGTLELETVKWMALIGTIGWFASTPLWMGRHA